MLIRDPCSASVRNAMRDEAMSARFYLPEPSTFMEEAADLAEMLCAMVGYSFVRRPITWPARMQYVKGEPNLLLEAAHNPSGMERAIPEIAAILPEKWSLLLGTSPQQFSQCQKHGNTFNAQENEIHPEQENASQQLRL